MEIMSMKTKDLTETNIEIIANLFPNCVSEKKDDNGKLKTAINFELLRQELSDYIIDSDEWYDFTWVGKKASMVEANRPTTNTLRPNKKDSLNWNRTENLYIEGDNLEVLKLLQESYLGKVKMIYIDPPYNTGNDFVYKDDFKCSSKDYEEESGQIDEEGNRLFKNSDSNGRFHSDWCSMIYSRLRLAKNLLSDSGVIFISIDDNEVDNLIKIGKEIFGESCYIANIIWQKKFSRANDAQYFSTMHDHIICFANNKWKIGLLPRGEDVPKGYSNPDNDPRGVWASVSLSAKSGSDSLRYKIITPSGKEFYPPNGRFWSCSETTYKKWVSENRVWFGSDGNGVPRKKTFLSEAQQGLRPNTMLFHTEVGNNQEGKKELNNLFDGLSLFDGPKPSRLLKTLLHIGNVDKEDIVLDFFSGSATTAQAVMELNAEDSGNRKYIMVQLPEKTDEKSDAFKAGYKNICEIGKERIRRSSKRIHEDNPEKKFDDGFRVFQLDSSNMKDVFYSTDDYTKDILDHLESNIKEDRSDLDLLFGCLIDWGLPISKGYESETIDGYTVHTYDEDALIACFDDDVSEKCMKEIAKRQPIRAIFKDSSFSDSAKRINVEEMYKMLSPNTTVKVI